MTRRSALLLILAVSAVGGASAADPETLEAIKREADLEKRSKFALEHARKQIDPMVEDYLAAEPEQARARLGAIVEAVEVSYDALEDTGKHPRAKPKHFKRAEIATRKLINSLEDCKRKLTFEEDKDLDPVIARIEEINQSLLMGIMRKK